MTTRTLTKQQASTHGQGIVCAECGKPYDNYDPGSEVYQVHYWHVLPASCGRCHSEIFMKVKRHNRRE